MNQFDFTGKIKSALGIMIGVGLLSILLGMFFADHSSLRIWSNVLHNTVFFTGIAFISFFLLCAKSLAYSGWHTQFRRLWEAYAQFLPVSIGLFLIIIAGMAFGWHHLYEWDVQAAVEHDDLLKHKSSLLNRTNYIICSVVVVGVWYFFAYLYRKFSLNEDSKGGLETFKKVKVLSGVFLPIGGFSSVFVIMLWIMSVDPHWYSTLFFWYTAASWLVSAVALTILLLLWLKQRGYYEHVNENHFHDLGKYLFGFSIFWTYLWFSQFMLIWYANVGEETVYFRTRYDEYPVLFTANLVINFAVPFFVLMRNSTKRKVGTLAFAAIIIFMGHWLDFFLMLKPGIWHADHVIAEVLQEAHGDHHGHDGSTTHLNDHVEDGHHDEAHAEGEHHDDDKHHSEEEHHDEAHADGEHHDEAHAEGEHHDDDKHHSEEEHHNEAHADGEHHDGEHHDEAHAEGDHHAEHGDDHAAGGHGDDHGHGGGGVNWGFTLPGWLELGMMIGFLGLFLYVIFTAFSKAPIIAENDPYLDESEHHEVVFNQN